MSRVSGFAACLQVVWCTKPSVQAEGRHHYGNPIPVRTPGEMPGVAQDGTLAGYPWMIVSARLGVGGDPQDQQVNVARSNSAACRLAVRPRPGKQAGVRKAGGETRTDDRTPGWC